MKKYDIIYADPPWHFSGSVRKGTAAANYTTMKMNAMTQIPIADISSDDAVLVMWYVSSQPQEALDLARAWGFPHIKTMNGFIWNKTTICGNPFFGMGFYTRAGAECALIATRKKSVKVLSHSVRQVRTAPNIKHSAKPGEFREDIVELFGDKPRVELFARTVADGWDAFGNEIPREKSIKALDDYYIER